MRKDGQGGRVSGNWSVNESWPEPLWLIFVSSPFEIKEILHLATLNNLEVIPLVQTFGHMEVSQRNRSHLMPRGGAQVHRQWPATGREQLRGAAQGRAERLLLPEAPVL